MEVFPSTEHVWFSQRVLDALIRTKCILHTLGNGCLENEVSFRQLASLESVEKIMEGLGRVSNLCGGIHDIEDVDPVFDDLPARIFRAVFSDDEWDELCETGRCIVHHDVLRLTELANKRLKRQLAGSMPQLLSDMAVALGNEEVLVRDCASVINRVMVACEASPCITEESRETPTRKREERSDEPEEDEKSASIGGGGTPSKKRAVQTDLIVLLEAAVTDVHRVRLLLTHMPLVPPDARSVGTSDGARIANDIGRLTSVLSGSSSEVSSLSSNADEVTVLRHWWQLAERALGMASLLMYLRNKPRKSSLKQSFSKIAGKVQEAAVRSYVQALKYERLGLFLTRFPVFLLQRHFVSLREFAQVIEKWEEIAPQMRSFWSQAGDELQVVQKRSASCCDNIMMSDRLWDCTKCGYLFHETCAGYMPGTLCEDLVVYGPGSLLPLSRRCGRCLGEAGTSAEHDAHMIAEKRSVAKYLSDASLTLDPVEGNCLKTFKVLQGLSRKHFSSRDNLVRFCRRLVTVAADKNVQGSLSFRMKHESDTDLRTFLRGHLLIDVDLHVILEAFVTLHNTRVEIRLFKALPTGVQEVRRWGTGPLVISLLGWSSGYISVLQ